MTLSKFLSNPPNIIVNAGAGTGKTEAICQGVGNMLGHTPTITPSPEQRALWDCMSEETHPGKVHMTSFSTAAADQLKERCIKDDSITSSSTYGMGLRQAYKFGLAEQNKGKPPFGKKYEYILSDILGVNRYQGGEQFKTLLELGEKARLELKTKLTTTELYNLADHYGLDVEFADDDGTEIVNQMLEKGLDRCHQFDYTDMVWIPLIKGAVKKSYDCLVVDEYQDMGIAQQEICMRLAWRIIVIGDPHQAIYGFAGADANAYKRMHGWLDKTKRGVVSLPMNLTRRCCRAIVREANKLLPVESWLVPLPDAPEGKVVQTSTMSMPMDVKTLTGDVMIICPTNAPMISLMFRMQEAGIKGYVASKDVGENMLEMVGETNKSVTELMMKTQGKIDKLNSKMGRAAAARRDTLNGLQEISKRCTTLSAVRSTITTAFPEKIPIGWTRMSSVHQVKGLEAERIVFYEWDRCKTGYDKKQWQIQNARNLLHVGLTRGKTEVHMARSEFCDWTDGASFFNVGDL